MVGAVGMGCKQVPLCSVKRPAAAPHNEDVDSHAVVPRVEKPCSAIYISHTLAMQSCNALHWLLDSGGLATSYPQKQLKPVLPQPTGAILKDLANLTYRLWASRPSQAVEDSPALSR